MEKDKNARLLKEKESLNQTIKDKDELILAQNHEIQNQQEKLSEIEKEYGKIAIQRMKEKVLIFDGESFKSAGVQIVEHLKKENDAEYRFILLTDAAKDS